MGVGRLSNGGSGIIRRRGTRLKGREKPGISRACIYFGEGLRNRQGKVEIRRSFAHYAPRAPTKPRRARALWRGGRGRNSAIPTPLNPLLILSRRRLADFFFRTAASLTAFHHRQHNEQRNFAPNELSHRKAHTSPKMKLSNPDSVSVYTVSGGAGRTLPDWLARRRKRSLKDDAEYQNRVELLQDFHFESASIRVRVSEDGNWVMSTGTYVLPRSSPDATS